MRRARRALQLLERRRDGLHLFDNSFAQQKLATDATDQDGQVLRSAVCALGRQGGLGGPFDQPVEMSAHQLGDGVLRHIARENHRVADLVDAAAVPPGIVPAQRLRRRRRR